MLFKLKKKHSDLIDNIEVEKFRREAHSYELIAALKLCDGGKIFIRDYQFQDGTRKYSYHWQSEKGEFKGRWDNAPHWPEINSYPKIAILNNIRLWIKR